MRGSCAAQGRRGTHAIVLNFGPSLSSVISSPCLNALTARLAFLLSLSLSSYLSLSHTHTHTLIHAHYIFQPATNLQKSEHFFLQGKLSRAGVCRTAYSAEVRPLAGRR